MEEELTKEIQETFKSLKSSNDTNPVSNSFILTYQNRMAGCLTQLVNQMQILNSTMNRVESWLQSIESNISKGE